MVIIERIGNKNIENWYVKRIKDCFKNKKSAQNINGSQLP
jgi:hypothetical protein